MLISKIVGMSDLVTLIGPRTFVILLLSVKLSARRSFTHPHDQPFTQLHAPQRQPILFWIVPWSLNIFYNTIKINGLEKSVNNLAQDNVLQEIGK